ncbi:hypothetical protein H206_05376 [Candidatus Electrothrix aarhusensis]|uniref:Selenide, water dikinase n=1 Tax=Candidatus Electrothrix aarhusensis TaxID=1859131 RepID=A0A3S3SQZ1_9BACT|nr:hypothetical protein H206_05376 [Candidatus Electrothrix aarhusensis]
MLLALPQAQATELLEALHENGVAAAACIGEVIEGAGGVMVG